MPRKAIVITGCSTGFGRCTALTLAQKGWLVFATVRNEIDREKLLQEAKTNGSEHNLYCILCDITCDDDMVHLHNVLYEKLHNDQSLQTNEIPKLHGLLNNAGVGSLGAIEQLPLKVIRSQFDVNLFGHIHITKVLLPYLKAAQGKVIFVSSFSGRIAVPSTGCYTASKHALEGLCDVLRLELESFGVRVSIIQPAFSPTDILPNSLMQSEKYLDTQYSSIVYSGMMNRLKEYGLKFRSSGFPVTKFSQKVLDILDCPRPRARYVIPQSMSIILILYRFLPDFLRDAIMRFVLLRKS